VCKCALYYCHQVSTQLQLNISYLNIDTPCPTILAVAIRCVPSLCLPLISSACSRVLSICVWLIRNCLQHWSYVEFMVISEVWGMCVHCTCGIITYSHWRYCIIGNGSVLQYLLGRKFESMRYIFLLGAHGGAVGWGTALQAGRSRVRFPMVSLGIFHWHNPSGHTAALGLTQPLNRYEYQECFLGVMAAGA